MLCIFLPAVSLGRGRAARRLGRLAQRAQPGRAVFEIPALAPMATIAGAMPSTSAASILSSQARADAKREAKEARNREREKRQTLQQYIQSMRESMYAQYRLDAAKDLQVHTLSYRHHASA